MAAMAPALRLLLDFLFGGAMGFGFGTMPYKQKDVRASNESLAHSAHLAALKSVITVSPWWRADAVKARPSLNGDEPVHKGRCPLNPALPGALAGTWPPGGPSTCLGTAQAAPPNANPNLRRRGTKTRH